MERIAALMDQKLAAADRAQSLSASQLDEETPVVPRPSKGVSGRAKNCPIPNTSLPPVKSWSSEEQVPKASTSSWATVAGKKKKKKTKEKAPPPAMSGLNASPKAGAKAGPKVVPKAGRRAGPKAGFEAGYKEGPKVGPNLRGYQHLRQSQRQFRRIPTSLLPQSWQLLRPE
ncbi:Uncharacterized protein OBRU01_04050 [Operophtera brumata]|uniref:Uncharacterized protein n=1 Tax=Operophtera brumata TaxID=104452 RepID=A0A0L7L667_OPEBR|nr:Uncharacterized protein OBRU01_04050 [Operophtera brumata]